MKFGIQVKVFNQHTKEYSWFWLHPVGAPRYEWSSRDEAQRTKDMCYPLADPEWVRVAEIKED